MRVLTTNLAATATLLGTDGFPLLAYTGYSAAALKEPTLDRTWKAVAAAVTHSIVLDLGAARTINCAAVFDLYAVALAAPTVALYSGPADSGPWTKRADLVDGGRRDWGAGFGGVTARYWRIDMVPNFGGTSQPEVAHIALGLATDLRRGEATREVESVDQILTNGSQATKAGEEYVRLSLRWGTLTAADHAELLGVKRSLGGGLLPFVVWPDAGSPGAVYCGRIAPGMRWAESAPVYTGHAWEFTEMERTLRG
jgi:hypothetical protein